jgi:hypothetical protein
MNKAFVFNGIIYLLSATLLERPGLSVPGYLPVKESFLAVLVQLDDRIAPTEI